MKFRIVVIKYGFLLDSISFFFDISIFLFLKDSLQITRYLKTQVYLTHRKKRRINQLHQETSNKYRSLVGQEIIIQTRHFHPVTKEAKIGWDDKNNAKDNRIFKLGTSLI